jgi:Protein of unknown function (DUF3551)
VGMSKANQVLAIVTVSCALLVVTVLSLILSSNSAQARYCLSTREFRNCGFSTWQQCQATRRGQGGVCYRKPGT